MQDTLRDVLRCETYIIGDTGDEIMKNRDEIHTYETMVKDTTYTKMKQLTNPEPRTPQKNNENSHTNGKTAYAEYMKRKKEELTLQFPSLKKKEIQEMALEAYREMTASMTSSSQKQKPKKNRTSKM